LLSLTSLPNLEKLIEGLKSPDTSLLLPDLLPMTDPFGSTSDAIIEKADVAVESLIPGLEPPVPQRLPSQTESVTSNRTGQSGLSVAAGTIHCGGPHSQPFHLQQVTLGFFCSLVNCP